MALRLIASTTTRRARSSDGLSSWDSTGRTRSLTDRYLEAGRLPNFRRLAAMGSYHRLRTTFPAVSPVAWSSFSTGTNPARHNIFDFLDRDRRTYQPLLSSTHIGRPDRHLRIGRFRIPLGTPAIRLLRKSRAVLVRPWRARHLEHDPARAHHVPARAFPRRATERDVGARSPRDAGHVYAVHDSSQRARGQGRRPADSRRSSRTIDSRRHSRDRIIRSSSRRRRWRCPCACASIAR